MRFCQRLADLVLFLYQGRALFFGPLKEFLASSDSNIQQFIALDAYQPVAQWPIFSAVSSRPLRRKMPR
jgi:ABC-type transporter Mla maintaining outer membrane lipid asymmetry ATPase subunit MlaF